MPESHIRKLKYTHPANASQQTLFSIFTVCSMLCFCFSFFVFRSSSFFSLFITVIGDKVTEESIWLGVAAGTQRQISEEF